MGECFPSRLESGGGGKHCKWDGRWGCKVCYWTSKWRVGKHCKWFGKRGAVSFQNSLAKGKGDNIKHTFLLSPSLLSGSYAPAKAILILEIRILYPLIYSVNSDPLTFFTNSSKINTRITQFAPCIEL